MKEKDADLFSPEGHRSRLRERYRSGGFDALLDYEKLELLLTFVNRRGDVKPTAKGLLKKFSSISGVLNAEEQDLRTVDGMGPQGVLLIRLMRDLYSRHLLERIAGNSILHETADTLDYVRLKLGNLKKEAFMVIFLNARNEVIDSELLASGTVDELYIHPREVFKKALEHSARSIILFHNHPSGDVSPSVADLKFTESVRAAGKAVRIDLLDHLIVSHNTCFSIESGRKFDAADRTDFSFSAAAEEVSPTPSAVKKGRTKTYDPLNFVHLAGILKRPYKNGTGEKKS